MYKDIFDHKGPFLYLLNIVGLLIGGGRNIGIWIIEIISLSTSLIFIYKSINLLYDKFISLLSTLSSLILFMLVYNGNIPDEYAVPFISMAMYYFCQILKADSVKKTHYLIIAICFSCILLLKPNLTAMWMVGWLIHFILLIKRNGLKALKSFIISSFLGIMIILIPFAIYFYATNSFADFKFCYWDFNKAYSDLAIKDMFIRSIRRCYLYPVYRYCNVHIFLFSFLIVSLINFRYSINKKITLFIISAIIISMVIVNFGPFLLVYYYLMFVPVAGFTYAMVYHFLKEKIAYRSTVICIILFIFVNSLSFSFASIIVRNHLVRETDKENLISCIKQNTALEDKITVFGNCCWIYSLSRRESASRYAYVTPAISVKNYGNMIYESYCVDIERNKPQMIIIDKEYSHVRLSEHSRIGSFVNSNYIQIDSSDYGHFDVWMRK
jgi:hypothetical protein